MKKNILYICTESAPGLIPYAGTIINTAAFSEKLNVFVLFLIDKEDTYRPIINSNINCYTQIIPSNKIKRIIYKLYPLKLFKSIIQIYRNHSIDTVHLLTVDYILALFLNRIQKKMNVVYTVHDLQPHVSASFTVKEMFIKKYIFNFSILNRTIANQLVTNSLFQHKQLLQRYPQKNIRFHHFPTLVTNAIKAGNNSIVELADIKDYILFFGNIDKYKGVDILYHAYLKSEICQTKHLVIAGKGNIYFTRNHEKEEKIHFLNRYIQDNEIKYLFENAYCVVYPYISITQSGVLSLSYYFQVPTIISNVDFFIENSIEDSTTDFVFEKGDVNTLVSTLDKIDKINNIEIDKIKQQQKLQYEKSYSTTGLILELESIYLK